MIVAFLQNPYFPPGTSATLVAKYRDRQDFHRRILANSNTGKRLVATFGDLYDRIHWDNANWRHVTQAGGKMPPDLEHIDRVLTITEPQLVLAFGRVAESAILPMVPKFGFEFLACTHPSAFGNTLQVLNDFVREIKTKYPHEC